MGQSKSPSRRPKETPLKQTRWLPVIVVGALLVLGAAAIMLRSNDKDATSQPDSIMPDLSFTPAVIGAPRVSVSQDYIDYGDVKLGTPVTTTFDVQNTGDLPLTILGEPRVELIEGC
ncbi:MAG: hypothetical protein HY866_14995 [Chloroflexi bacterium]|nr:hypothetical protein [Chloroflexota bacterium]